MLKLLKANLFLSLLLLSSACSTLSQNIESPVVLKPMDWSVGVGSGYSHNVNHFPDDERQKEEMVPSPFLGGRFGIFRNVEAGVTAGSLGLTLGTAADFRLRYMWWGGWKRELQLMEMREKEILRKAAKNQKFKEKRKKVEDDLDAMDLEGLDDPLVLVDGWMSTVSLGGFWSGYNAVEDFSVGTHHTGIYLSNSVGYKSKRWLYYFGAKVVQLETDYHFKSDRLNPTFDVNSQFEKMLYGVFAGVTYSWSSKKGHVYQWDTLLSLMQLPRSPDDRTIGYFPGITMSFWYID